jgi:hypothetical protein
MYVHRWRGSIIAIAISTSVVISQWASAVIIATSKGAGADAEVRDHQPTTNFGASTELGTRIVDNFPMGHASDGTDRFSAIYLKFDITGQTVLPNQVTSVRLTYRNDNFTSNRVHDTTPPGNNTAFRTGLAFYGLDRDNAGNNWFESTISYLSAPGLANGGDFNNGTKDFDFVDPDGAGAQRAPLTPLGVALFPVVPPQNHLPVGGQLIFSSDALNSFVTQSITTGKATVTIVAGLIHDGKVPINDWKNFNYLFNPKEQVTLATDATFDSDTANPSNPLGGPFSGASNAANASGFSPFSPQLIMTLPGDFNFDGLVNSADYVAWRNGEPAQPAYATWRSNFGLPSASGTAAPDSVPEPGFNLLLTAAAPLLLNRRSMSTR